MNTQRFTFKVANIKIIVFLILYRIFIDICYFKDISLTYGYLGFKDYRTFGSLILSWIIAFYFFIPIIKLLNRKEKSFSSNIVFAMMLISVIPFSSLVYSGIFPGDFIIKYIIYWSIFIFLYLKFSKKNVKPISLKFNNVNIDNKMALLIGICSIILVMFISYKYARFRLNFNLFDVYELRHEFSNFNFPTIISYLFAWTKQINLILMAYCLVNKKYFVASLCFITQMFSFGIDGLKTTFFLAILAAAFCLIFSKREEIDTKKIILYGITGISFLSVLEILLLNSNNISTLVIRRMLFLPIQINSYYVDFFSTHTPDFFKSSFLRYFGFKTSYYRLDHIIGNIYYNSPNMGCNNGLIAEAVTNFGNIGILIMPVILVWLFKFMDKCSNGLNSKIYFVASISFAIVLTNTFITTALLTHGLLIANLMFILLNNSKNKSIEGGNYVKN